MPQYNMPVDSLLFGRYYHTGLRGAHSLKVFLGESSPEEGVQSNVMPPPSFQALCSHELHRSKINA